LGCTRQLPPVETFFQRMHATIDEIAAKTQKAERQGNGDSRGGARLG